MACGYYFVVTFTVLAVCLGASSPGELEPSGAVELDGTGEDPRVASSFKHEQDPVASYADALITKFQEDAVDAMRPPGATRALNQEQTLDAVVADVANRLKQPGGEALLSHIVHRAVEHQAAKLPRQTRGSPEDEALIRAADARVNKAKQEVANLMASVKKRAAQIKTATAKEAAYQKEYEVAEAAIIAPSAASQRADEEHEKLYQATRDLADTEAALVNAGVKGLHATGVAAQLDARVSPATVHAALLHQHVNQLSTAERDATSTQAAALRALRAQVTHEVLLKNEAEEKIEVAEEKRRHARLQRAVSVGEDRVKANAEYEDSVQEVADARAQKAAAVERLTEAVHKAGSLETTQAMNVAAKHFDKLAAIRQATVARQAADRTQAAAGMANRYKEAAAAEEVAAQQKILYLQREVEEGKHALKLAQSVEEPRKAKKVAQDRKIKISVLERLRKNLAGRSADTAHKIHQAEAQVLLLQAVAAHVRQHAHLVPTPPATPLTHSASQQAAADPKGPPL